MCAVDRLGTVIGGRVAVLEYQSDHCATFDRGVENLPGDWQSNRDADDECAYARLLPFTAAGRKANAERYETNE